MGDLALEVGGLPEVVAVEERDEVAGGGADAGVAGAREAAVFLDEVDDLAGEFGEEGGEGELEGGGVGRAVVDDEDLVGRDGLGEGGAEGFGEVQGDVVGGDDDADARRGGGWAWRRWSCCGGSPSVGFCGCGDRSSMGSSERLNHTQFGEERGGCSPDRAGAAGAAAVAAAALRARLCLLYHELVPEGSAYAYAMATAEFRRQVELVGRLQAADGAGLVPELTFDDGHVSNVSEAMPVLARAGVRARFFYYGGMDGDAGGVHGLAGAAGAGGGGACDRRARDDAHAADAL